MTGPRKHIGLACATHRGLQVARRLRALRPDDALTIFTFREEPWEPAFFADLKQFAQTEGARLIETRQLHAEALQSLWDEADLDLLFCVSWRYLLTDAVLKRPRSGTFVFHDSLLPRRRGFAPTVWAMIAGDTETGVTLFELTAGDGVVDSGPIVDQRAVPIGPGEEIGPVMARVTAAYLDLLEANLPALLDGTAPRQPQDESRATYTCKRVPDDGRIDWRAGAGEIHNLIRASARPYPGAFTELGGEKVTVWSAALVYEDRRYEGAIPGRVIERRADGSIVVLTGDGALRLTELQKAGEPAGPAASVARSLSDTFR